MTSTHNWFITGTSSGIGEALARVLLNHGHRVVGTARQPDDLSDDLTGHENFTALPLDVTDQAAVDEAVERAADALPSIDVVHNNAGYGLMGAIEELPIDKVRALFEVNVFGAIRVTQAFLPHLRRQGHGHLVYTSSVAAHITGPAGFAAYNASKHALEGFAATMAKEVAPHGITVTLVEPGPVATKFATSSLDQAEPMDAYADTVGQTRAFIANGFSKEAATPEAIAKGIHAAVHETPPPLMRPLTRGALDAVRAAQSETASILTKGASASEAVPSA